MGLVYVLGTLLLNGPLGLPIQLAVLLAYTVAVTLHFSMQRWFVFAHVAEFHLSVAAQLRSYVVIGGVQYALTALATTFLPDALGVSETVVYLGCVGILSSAAFIGLRTLVFHARTGAQEENTPVG